MTTRTCRTCLQSKPISDFYIDRGKFVRLECKPCTIVRNNAHARKDPGRRRQTAVRHYRNLRLQTLIAYGGNHPSCACCGESQLEFLTLDHMDNNGAEHRRRFLRTRGLYSWLKSNSYPPGYQVLCWNCNSAKGVYGRCPHTLDNPDEWRKTLQRPLQNNRMHLLTHNGKTMSISHWAREVGISRWVIRTRINNGWTVERALSEPVKRRN